MVSKVKNVMITGANRGIGYHLLKSIVRRLKPEVVIATYRNPEKSKDLLAFASSQKETDIQCIQLDIGDHGKHADVEKAVDVATLGTGLNLLINNAGISTKVFKLSDATYEDLKINMDTNFIAPVLLTKALAPHLAKASSIASASPCGIGRAAVVNLSSVLGSIGANDIGGLYSYRCSKAALNTATKSMSLDLKKSKIIAIALHPGWVKTDMGGPKAPLSLEESVEGIVGLLESLNESHNGQFLQYDGKELAW